MLIHSFRVCSYVYRSDSRRNRRAISTSVSPLCHLNFRPFCDSLHYASIRVRPCLNFQIQHRLCPHILTDCIQEPPFVICWADFGTFSRYIRSTLPERPPVLVTAFHSISSLADESIRMPWQQTAMIRPMGKPRQQRILLFCQAPNRGLFLQQSRNVRMRANHRLITLLLRYRWPRR